jgi:methyl-accepting chemotaxis protein
MKFRTIVLGVAGAVFLVGISISSASFFLASAFQEASAQSRVLMSSMRYQMTADMYHDSMRGIVYRAMYASTTGDAAMASQANGEVVEYAQAFRDAIAAQGPLDLPEDIRAALGTVAAPLDGYISSAQLIVDKAGKAGAEAAKAQLADFETAFSTLEDAMANISDAIEAANVRAIKGAGDIAIFSDIANWSGIGITLMLVAAMLALSQRFVTRPLVAMTRTMQRLAEGDTQAMAEQQQPVAEIGAMAAALAVFREALASRANLTREAEANSRMTASKAAETLALNKSQFQSARRHRL